jgi:membrane protein implicated in regulation of membrane protease activity
MKFLKSILSRLIRRQKSVDELAIEYDTRFRGEATVILVKASPRFCWLGRVAFAGSYWNARTLSPAMLEEGDICEVIGICNITLIIRPFSELKSLEVLRALPMTHQ